MLTIPLPGSEQNTDSRWQFGASRTKEPPIEYADIRVAPGEIECALECLGCGETAKPGDLTFAEGAKSPNGRWIKTEDGWLHACHGYATPPSKARCISGSIWE